jgi:hypothetical protein
VPRKRRRGAGEQVTRGSLGPLDEAVPVDALSRDSVAFDVSDVGEDTAVQAGHIEDQSLADGHFEAVDMDVVVRIVGSTRPFRPIRQKQLKTYNARRLSVVGLGRLIARIPIKLDPLLTSKRVSLCWTFRGRQMLVDVIRFRQSASAQCSGYHLLLTPDLIVQSSIEKSVSRCRKDEGPLTPAVRCSGSSWRNNRSWGTLELTT